jgi:4-hydroxy-L-threonine phosphate dehydrogenase PdxA
MRTGSRVIVTALGPHNGHYGILRKKYSKIIHPTTCYEVEVDGMLICVGRVRKA